MKLSNIRIVYRGGLTLDEVAKQPADLVNTFFFRATGGVPPREPYATPEREKEYPEPSMFGMLPAYGFFIRHATGIELNNVDLSYMKEDRRPAFVLDQVRGMRSGTREGAESRRRSDFRVAECRRLRDG